MKSKIINLPIKDSDIENLRAGDTVYLNGDIYVARDAAHKRLYNLILNNTELPFDLKNNVIYYMGPSPTPPNKVIGSAGPTTSHRMDKYTPILLKNGLKGMIGKGKRSDEVIEAIKDNNAIYFVTVGGTGALLQDRIKSNELIAYEDLGPEAIRKIKVENFPVMVGIDKFGNNLFTSEKEKYKNKWF